MDFPANEHELLRLIARICDGRATEAERRWLERAVAVDERIRRAYLELTDLETELFFHVLDHFAEADRGVKVPLIADLAAIFDAPVERVAAASPRPASPAVLTRVDAPQRLAARWSVMVLFSVFFAGLTISSLLLTTAQIPFVSSRPSVSASPPVAAPSARVVGAGETARVDFGATVQVMLRGPAEFIPQSASSGFLRRGRLRAHVAPGPIDRFEIITPAARIVDLGTDFEVVVIDPAQTAVRVVSGTVEVAPRSGAETDGPGRQLYAGDTVVVDGPKAVVRRLKSDEAVALLGPKLNLLDAAFVGAPLPVQEGLAVHLDAGNVNGAYNAGLSNGAEVRQWRNLAPAASSIGDFVGSAHLQVPGPNILPALQFNGRTDYFSNPQTLGNGTSESLTIFAVARLTGWRRGHVLSTHDVRRGTGWALHFNTREGVMYYHTTFTRSVMFRPLKSEGLHLLEMARTGAPAELRGLTLRVDGGVAERALDMSIKPSGAGISVGGPAHFLAGEVAEALIYQRALTPDECERVRRFLARKHQVNLAENSPPTGPPRATPDDP